METKIINKIVMTPLIPEKKSSKFSPPFCSLYSNWKAMQMQISRAASMRYLSSKFP